MGFNANLRDHGFPTLGALELPRSSWGEVECDAWALSLLGNGLYASHVTFVCASARQQMFSAILYLSIQHNSNFYLFYQLHLRRLTPLRGTAL